MDFPCSLCTALLLVVQDLKHFVSFQSCKSFKQWMTDIIIEPHICFVGTTKIKNLDNNIGSLKVKLSNDDLREITEAIPISEVVGDRTVDTFMRCSWKFANTPPKHS